jgi:hypothetical protein
MAALSFLAGGCGDYFGQPSGPPAQTTTPNLPPSLELRLSGESCPSLNFALIAPDQLVVGATALLQASASDAQGRALSYAWLATSGNIFDPTSPWSTYECVEPGPHALWVFVTNGSCEAPVQELAISCVSPEAAPASLAESALGG